MNIGQKYYDSSILPDFDGEYSVNLLEPEIAIVSLNIYACPGSKFKINDKTEITISGTGNYTLQCSTFPIVDIRMHESNRNLMHTIPAIIDYVKAEG